MQWLAGTGSSTASSAATARIGEELGVTAEAARRLVKRAVDELQSLAADGEFVDIDADADAV